MRRILLGLAALLIASFVSVACSDGPTQPACTSNAECLQGQICKVDTGECVDEASGETDAGSGGSDASNPPPPPPPPPNDGGRPGREDAGPVELPDGGLWHAQVVFDRTEGAAEDPLAGSRVSATVLSPERTGFCATGEWDEPADGIECCYTGRPITRASYNAGEITATAGAESVTLAYESGVYATQALEFAAGTSLRATTAGEDPIPGRSAGPIALPTDLQLTAPAAGTSLARTGFDVTWNGSSSQSARALISVVQHAQNGAEIAAVACLVPDSGSFKLETTLLNELSAGPASLVVQRIAETARPAEGSSGLQVVARNGTRTKVSLK